MTTNLTEQARFNMIQQQIRPWEVLDRKVLDLVGELPRETFVPEAYRGLAYADIEIPLPGGEQMMFPRAECRLLQALNLQPTDRVLEIGTGSGYLTACLAKLAAEVTSLEIDEELCRQAETRLESLAVGNVKLLNQDVFAATPEGPFDAIAITGSLPELSDHFKELLSIGGRLFAIIGESPAMEATLVTRVSENAWHVEGLFETDIPPLRNTPRPNRFKF